MSYQLIFLWHQRRQELQRGGSSVALENYLKSEVSLIKLALQQL